MENKTVLYQNWKERNPSYIQDCLIFDREIQLVGNLAGPSRVYSHRHPQTLSHFALIALIS